MNVMTLVTMLNLTRIAGSSMMESEQTLCGACRLPVFMDGQLLADGEADTWLAHVDEHAAADKGCRGAEPTYWENGVEYCAGLPVHLMMPVDRRGNGPLCDDAPLCGCCDPIAKWICWCGDKSCPGPQ